MNATAENALDVLQNLFGEISGGSRPEQPALPSVSNVSFHAGFNSFQGKQLEAITAVLSGPKSVL